MWIDAYTILATICVILWGMTLGTNLENLLEYIKLKNENKAKKVLSQQETDILKDNITSSIFGIAISLICSLCFMFGLQKNVIDGTIERIENNRMVKEVVVKNKVVNGEVVKKNEHTIYKFISEKERDRRENN